MSADVLAALVSIALAVAVSAVTCRLVMAAGIWDAPNNEVRKAHVDPTPTSGGLGVAAGLAAGIAAFGFLGPYAWAQAVSPDMIVRTGAAVALALGALALGLYDDVRPLGPRLKFAALTALALAAPLLVGRAEALPIGVGVVIPLGFAIGVIGSALWVFTLANAVNFMDGANGLALGSAGIGLVGLAAASLVVGAPHAALAAGCAAAAIAGFLIWNFPHGRVFAGDAGSLFVGTLAATAALLAIEDGGLSPFVAVIPFFPLLADVLLTLDWRRRQKRRVLEGHRDHMFQIALRDGVPHWKVSLIYWGLSLKCAALAVVLAFTGRVPPPPVVAEAVAAADPAYRLFLICAAAVASLAAVITFVVLALVAVRVSKIVRRYAAARGHDAP
jgi:UDP-N-acetylmuramyl pentapeptide phosphotransferase/UDP-N-acetylglucosamine-1-phosphate transferase